MGPTQRVIVGLSGGPDVKYSSYTKYPENLVLITNLFFNLRQMEAVLPERMETSAWTSSLITPLFLLPDSGHLFLNDQICLFGNSTIISHVSTWSLNSFSVFFSVLAFSPSFHRSSFLFLSLPLPFPFQHCPLPLSISYLGYLISCSRKKWCPRSCGLKKEQRICFHSVIQGFYSPSGHLKSRFPASCGPSIC